MSAHRMVLRAAVPSMPAVTKVAARIKAVQKVSPSHRLLETMLTGCVSSSVHYFVLCFAGYFDRYFVYSSVDNFRPGTNIQWGGNDSKLNNHIVPIPGVGLLFH
jgi:hypothetical protein